MIDWLNKTHVGDCRELMRQMAAGGVRAQMCVTSPPYWGLRDYEVAGQIGLEPTLTEWVERIVEVFRCVRDVLAEDGTVWLNLGDVYANDGKWGGSTGGLHAAELHGKTGIGRRKVRTGLKPKELMGQPWRVAFALQDDGWFLRSDIIWHKPNVMPESVEDRPTKCHEYVFLLTRSERYYYAGERIREPLTGNTHARGNGINPKASVGGLGQKQNESFSAAISGSKTKAEFPDSRNARTVWSIPTQPFSGAHFATFPEALVARCILAGSRSGDTVLDPFMGSGTVGKVATDLARDFVGCELNPDYVELHELRRTTIGMPL